MKYKRKYLAMMTLCLSISSSELFAGNIGSDLNLSLSPAAGGMGGVGYVSPQDPVASVFGNPATLTQLSGGTDFTFGASYLNVDAKAAHDGSITGAPFDDTSDAEHYVLPNIAVRQRLTDDLVLGGGLQVISGLGADFRDANPLGQVVQLIVFGANVGLGYELTPNTSIGAGLTLSYGLLEFGLTSNTASQETFGGRGTLGLTHDLGPIKASLTYNSELALDFDNVIQTTPSSFGNIDLEQPRELIAGIATTPALWPNLLLETNLIWKNWEDAKGYQDIWKDTYTLALGGQYKVNKWKLRVGYSYTTDLQKKNVGNTLAGINSLNVPGQGVAPMSKPLVQFIQATLTQPYWQQQISAGIGYEITDRVHVDLHAGYAFDGDRRIAGTELDVNEFQMGAGFTWAF